MHLMPLQIIATHLSRHTYMGYGYVMMIGMSLLYSQ